jgi:MFS family permease
MPSTSEEPDPLEPAALVDPASSPHDPYAVLRDPRVRNYLGGNMLAIIGMQMEMMSLRYELYNRTNSALPLGMMGLVQVAPVLALMLLAGHVADRFNRKWVMISALATTGIAALGLAAVSHWHGPILAVYACLAVNGVGRAFLQPAKQALLPQLTRPENFSNAVTWGSGVFHLGSVIGPALAGWVLAATESPALIYLLNATAVGVFILLLLPVRLQTTSVERRELSVNSLLAGVRYVWGAEIVFGAMALDMFAVLLGGAVALLPVFARDVLHVGPTGLGWMETAPAVGSVMTSVVLAHRPPLRRAGHYLLWAVAGFGLTMIVFGLSQSFALSLVVLFLSGAFDNVSVVIRQTLVQLQTPDAMRGRVSAVNSLFIGMSNELGGFESGVTADWFGKVASVVGGGVGTLAVVAFAAWKWPRLRRFDRLVEEEGGRPSA